MHDGAVGLDRPPYNVVAILEVDDDNLRLSIIIELLAHANEGV